MTDTTPNNPPGTPIWVDHTSPDVQASARFYGDLFGWTAEDLGEEAGHYTMFRSNGKVVAATTPPMSPGTPSMWSTYISTTDANETAKKVADAGGQTLVAPFAVMDAGSMGVFADPTGAVFCVWQSGNHKGAEVFNTPVSLSWNELATRDMDKAKDFYREVFGWTAKSNPMPDGGEYIEWQINGKSVGGGSTMLPEGVPPNWLVYFAVANTDNTVSRAKQLGGQAMMEPVDIPQGRMAVLTDPQGAAFAIIQLSGAPM